MSASTEMLPRTRGTSLHRQMFMVVRESILTGRYPVNAPIPSEEELCNHFGVSRITVRRALADLEAEGYVRRRQGLGTFVSPDLPRGRTATTLSFVEALHKSAEETRVEVISCDTLVAPLRIAQQLHLPPDALAVHAIRLRRIEDTPVMVTDAWVPERFSQAINAETLKKQAMYEILLGLGIEFGRVIQDVTAVSADPSCARWLNVDIGAPLLRVTRIVYDCARTPVQHLTLTMSPEHSRIVVDMMADSINTLRTGQIVHDVPAARPKTATGRA
ncbi:GntR family transcriptional regulator [Bordetella genomosp. 12]|uniref:GntR family transcriptional regulator n=1 Tax=Bordetella genomosp. 12 TaxID=463035 RepID=A0A261VEA5_9BORD|nr:GntR family transcriptional regulator [Bordetella genomosp. 12]OZI71882.1 GntR family transcriptional regulator [Bordetella genomosp. 12]